MTETFVREYLATKAIKHDWPADSLAYEPRGVLLLGVPMPVSVAVQRQQHRARCAVCEARRVVYRVVVNETPTEARCAPCLGIREEGGL